MCKFSYIALFVLLSQFSVAQGKIDKKTKLSDKVFFGAGLGLQFGSYTAIEVSPMVGYIPIDDLYLGLKGKYEFYKTNSMSSGTSVYGGSVFATYAIMESVLAYAEYEAISLESVYFDPGQAAGSGDRFWLQSPLIGGGFLQSLGGRSKVMFLLLWNLNESYNSYYTNPIVRVSFLF